MASVALGPESVAVTVTMYTLLHVGVCGGSRSQGGGEAEHAVFTDGEGLGVITGEGKYAVHTGIGVHDCVGAHGVRCRNSA